MGVKVAVIFLFMLVATWASEARELGFVGNSVLKVNLKEVREAEASEMDARNDNVCTLCEEYASLAVDYLGNNKTQTEILETLLLSCSRVPTFKKECTTLVNYYAPLFFLEVSTINPDDFCQKFNLCDRVVTIASQFREDSCGMCHHAVAEVLIKLQDPDTQLEILQLLLKGCNSVQNHVKQCKKMVFEYAPLILANAEQYLTKNDICTILHACDHATTSPLISSQGVADS